LMVYPSDDCNRKCFRMVPERWWRRFWRKYEAFSGSLYERCIL